MSSDMIRTMLGLAGFLGDACLQLEEKPQTAVVSRPAADKMYIRFFRNNFMLFFRFKGF